jgi:hypothetical protein
LTPDDKVIHKEWEKDMKEAKEYVRKLSIISTKDKDKEEPVEEKENVQEKVSWIVLQYLMIPYFSSSLLCPSGCTV